MPAVRISSDTTGCRPHDEPQDIFLGFRDKVIEAEYIHYMHPRPLRTLLVVWAAAAIIYVNTLVTTPGLLYEMDVSFYAIATFVALLYHIGFRVSGKPEAPPSVMLIERLLLVANITFTVTKDLVIQLIHFRTCEAFPSTAIDQRRAFTTPNCESSWSPFAVIGFSIATITQIVPFGMVFPLAVYIIGAHCFLWLAIPPPNPVVQVWMYAAYVAAGVGFVTFVRYDQERVQRRQFLRYRQLRAEQRLLSQQEEALHKFCTTLLPPSFLKRLADVDANATLDSTDRGAVLLAGVHDFGLWCTRHTPVEGATAMILLQSNFRTIAVKHGVEVVGCRGDTVVSVANLIHRVSRARQRMLYVALEVMDMQEICRGPLPPIRAAINFGCLEGGFVGTLTIRYDVFGPCYDVAQEALLECPADRVMVSATTNPDSLLVSPVDSETDQEGGTPPTQVIQGQSFDVLDSSALRASLVDDFGSPGTSSIGSPRIISPKDSSLALVHDQLRRTLALNGSGPEASLAPTVENAERNSEPDGLARKLERYRATTTAWCCFPRFADDEVEEAFVAERMEVLPGAASRTWFAYALYVLVILILLLVDMHGPHAIIGVVLLVLAIVMSLLMGAAPVLLKKSTMRRWFFPWSVVGVLLPLLVVYGAAVTRPSAIGNDVRLFLFIGALVRSYCFTSSRWQAVFVPLALLVGLGQYALPGAVWRVTVVFVFLLIVFSIFTDREREGSHRDNVRRKVELQFILARQRATERLRKGLIRNAIPTRVMRQINEAEGSVACQTEGAALAIRATLIGDRQNGSTASLAVAAQRFALLEELLEDADLLSIGSLLGDQAIVVGPAAVGPEFLNNKDLDRAIEQAIDVGVRLVEAYDQPSAAISYAAILDYDSMVHAVHLSDVAQYFALGVTVTRLLTFMAATDPAAHSGCLVTERIVHQASSLGLLNSYNVVDTGRMKLRGLGVIRLSKLTSIMNVVQL